jgi:hypothetical protein
MFCRGFSQFYQPTLDFDIKLSTAGMFVNIIDAPSIIHLALSRESKQTKNSRPHTTKKLQALNQATIAIDMGNFYAYQCAPFTKITTKIYSYSSITCISNDT